MYSILIVDDEPIMRQGIRTILSNSNFEISLIQEAGNGKEALLALQQFRYDIIITDIKMPEMDGLELCQKVQRRCPDIALLIISGYDDFAYAQTAIKYGVKHYALKPVIPKKLIAALENVIASIEKEKTYLYVPFQSMNTIVKNFEHGIWDNDKKSFDNAYLLISQISTTLPLDHLLATCQQIITIIINRLSLKIGYSVSVIQSQPKLSTKKDVLDWFTSELDSIRREFTERLFVADYNIIELSKKYIQENYNKEITLNDISNSINLNPAYFSSLFKQKTGQTFVQYKTNLRLEKARELLRHTNKSITEIAFEIGFNNVTHFTRTFKKNFGFTPSHLRKK